MKTKRKKENVQLDLLGLGFLFPEHKKYFLPLTGEDNNLLETVVTSKVHSVCFNCQGNLQLTVQ